MSFFKRLVKFLASLLGLLSQADDFKLFTIGEDQEDEMITLTAAHPQAYKRIEPNKGDTDVIVVSILLNGSATGDANVKLEPYASAPGDPLKFQLTRLNPTPSPATLEIKVQPDTSDPLNVITKNYQVEALPEDADDFDLVDIT